MSNSIRKPQGALEWNEKQIQKVLTKSGYVLGFPKIDGVRLIIRHDPYSEGQKVTLRSRSGKNFPALKDLADALNKAAHLFPQRSDVPVEYEGELVVTDGVCGDDLPCEETSGILQRNEQVGLDLLRLYVYERVADGCESVTYPHRALSLRNEWSDLMAALLVSGVHGLLVAYAELRSIQDITAHYDRMRQAGWEGGIYRDPECPVRSGKVLGMWKRKPFETQDGIITGLIEACDEDGNPKGMIGSLVVQYEDGTTGKAGAGALTHDQRVRYWRNPEYILRRYCEVKMMEETGKGGKRHPNFAMFRDTEDNKGVKV